MTDGESEKMIAPATHVAAVQADLDAACWLLEQLAADAGHSADRARIRRSLEEAADAWPAGPEDRWWKWLVEASRSLGRKCKVVDCTFDQLMEVVGDGARVVTVAGKQRHWMALGPTRGRRVQLLRPQPEASRTWVRWPALRRSWELADHDAVVRCLILEPPLAATADAHAGASGKRTPLNRLWALLRPEASDLWIIVIFALVTGLLALATPLAVETLVNTVAFGRLLQPVVVLAMLLLGFLSFSAALRALQTYVVEIVQRRLFARIAADLAFRLPRVAAPALDGYSGRALANYFFDVVTVQKVSAQLLLDGISLVMGVLVGMAVLAFYHPWLLGFDMVLLALIAVAIFVLGRGAVYSSIKESKTKYQTAAWLEDLAGCPTAFRLGGAAEFALERADQLIHDYLQARKHHFRVLMRQILFALTIQALASTVLLGLGGWLVISGQLTLGQLVAAELIVTVIVGAFAKLGKHMESYYDLLAAVDKLGVLFDLPMERQDGLLAMPHGRPAQVALRGVSCTTASGGRLQNLNLSIGAGQRLMLTGPSGSGKSDLLDLLFALRVPTAGHLTINGVDPRELRPDALRRYVALVRDVEVVAGTLAENVHLERPDISIGDVREALHKVGLMDQVLQLPEGLNTPLVAGGYPLTTNQCRKLMLARAIVGRPSLLLIDGLLDALPDCEAQQLTEMLVDPQQPWTLVMVTGRPSIAAAGTTTHTLAAPQRPVIEEQTHAH